MLTKRRSFRRQKVCKYCVDKIDAIDFKDFFFLCYVVAPKMRATTVGFLQQTAVS